MHSHVLPLLRFVTLSAIAAGALLCSGCATVTGEATQRVTIVAVDAEQRPVPGMRCRVINGSAEYYGDSPMYDVPVRRSFSDLEIECRRGALMARGTAISRSGMSLLQGMLPGGSALIAVDHISGYLYTYPADIRVRAGEHLVFDSERPRGELAADTGHSQ